MGNSPVVQNLQKESTSKYILSDKNLFQLENAVLELSSIDRNKILVKNIKVGEWLNPKTNEVENVCCRTFIYGNST
jgi:hypothetical protein